jgi:hypothetical protein
MTLSTLATLVGMLNGVITFVRSLFGGSSATSTTKAAPDATVQAVETANQAAKASADVTRTTSHRLDQELAHVDQETVDTADRVAGADSLRAQRDALADAIARANQDPGADSQLR